MKNKISDLRNHLFEVIEMLKDKDAPMDIERAKAVAAIAQVIVNSAKVEVQHMQVSGSLGTGFIPDALPEAPTPIALRSIARGGGA
jgi:hypothetical protein